MVRSTEARVRSEAGFVGNSNITTTDIQTYQIQSYNIIRGMVASRYDITKLDSSNADFVGSQAEGFLQRVEELMAAGYLLIKEYGPDGTEEKEDGELKLKEAEDLLASLFSKTPTRLIDINAVEFPTVPVSSGGAIASTGMTNKCFWIKSDTVF